MYVVSGVPQGSIWVGSCSSCSQKSFSLLWKTSSTCYADDSTLVAVVPSPAERVVVAESMNRDLNRVSVLCDLWGMKLNGRKSLLLAQFIPSLPHRLRKELY